MVRFQPVQPKTKLGQTPKRQNFWVHGGGDNLLKWVSNASYPCIRQILLLLFAEEHYGTHRGYTVINYQLIMPVVHGLKYGASYNATICQCLIYLSFMILVTVGRKHNPPHAQTKSTLSYNTDPGSFVLHGCFLQMYFT
ncbi:hypothetical protein SESBI_26612 [Sesbania bispinosa]|nr:hypothetical protein SESBI_26612 [Sesbania bispinosa]